MTDLPAILTPEGFAAAQTEELRSRVQVYPARTWHPSSAGHPCDRHQVWRFNRWQEQRPYDPTLQSIFDEGNMHQPDVYRRLNAMGFGIVQESDRPKEWKVGAATISGRVDGRLKSYGAVLFLPTLVLEIKSMSGHQWDRIETVDDIRRSPAFYVRGYWQQMQLYLILEELDQGVIVIKNKATGLLKLLLVELDYAEAEAIVKRIERLQGMVTANADPPPIDYDDQICGRCPFSHICYPPRDMGTGLQLLEDAQLLEDLDRRAELQVQARAYDSLDKSIKARLKRLGTFEAAAIGGFVIERTEVPVKGYVVASRTDVRFEIRRLDAKQIEDGE